jgi:hypothetical protein
LKICMKDVTRTTLTISTSSLLLGFAHFENFITKYIEKILVHSPEKNDLKISLKTILEKDKNLIDSMAKEQARKMIFSDKIKFIEKNISTINKKLIEEIKTANDIRNCLMHNNGLADKRLNTGYSEGQKIILTSGRIHSFGIQARQLSDEIWTIF